MFAQLRGFVIKDMSASPCDPASEDSSSVVSLAPRLSFEVSETREVSYVDLFERYYQENGLSEVDENSMASEHAHHYPVFMQNILERIEKYGQLAVRDDIARHTNAINSKDNEDTNLDAYYDLDDRFIDDEDVSPEIGDDSEFKNAVSSGFYVMDAEDYEPAKAQPPRKTPKKKPVPIKSKYKLQDFPKNVTACLVDIIKLYSDKKDKTNSSYPKGVKELFGKLGVKLAAGKADVEKVYALLAKISKQRPDALKIQVEKMTKQRLKKEIEKKLSTMLTELKENIKKNSPKWSQVAEKQRRILKHLRKLVDSSNEFEETYSKKKNLMVFEEEEKKVRETIRELYSKMKKGQNEANSVSNTPFTTPMKIIQHNYPILSPLQVELPLPKKMPPRNCIFDEPPEYREEDFLLVVEEEGESIAS